MTLPSVEVVASRLKSIVGDQFVDFSHECRTYHSSTMLPSWYECQVVVHPDNAHEVVAIVEFAN